MKEQEEIEEVFEVLKEEWENYVTEESDPDYLRGQVEALAWILDEDSGIEGLTDPKFMAEVIKDS